MQLDIQTWNTIGVFVTAVATILLVIVTALLTKATNRLNSISAELKATQHSVALTQALNAQNEIVLSRDENLKIADALIAQPGIDHSPEKARERWVCFVILNVQQLIFAARIQDKSFSEFWNATEHDILDRLLTNATVLELLQTRGYSPEFVKYCEKRRQMLSKS